MAIVAGSRFWALGSGNRGLLALGGSRAPLAPRGIRLRVTIDTLRAGWVRAYGHAGARTPAFDAVAGRGMRFGRAFAERAFRIALHLDPAFGPRNGLVRAARDLLRSLSAQPR